MFRLILAGILFVSAGCAHINTEKVLGTAKEIQSAAERVARFQLAFAAALADDGRSDLCIPIAEVALWTMSSVPAKIASIASELGLVASPETSPTSVLAAEFCAREPGEPEPEPEPDPPNPARWSIR